MTRDDHYQATDAAAAFMRLRLEELEATATAAGGDEWEHDSSGLARVGENAFAGQWTDSGLMEFGAEGDHAALNNPRAALASVAADRLLLDTYEEAGSIAHPDPADTGYLDGIAHAVRCRAAAWAKHPDYKQEWRP